MKMCFLDSNLYHVSFIMLSNVLLGYLLEPDVSKRPDIYQVCHVVHHLRGFSNPVANVFVSYMQVSCLCVSVCLIVHSVCSSMHNFDRA